MHDALLRLFDWIDTSPVAAIGLAWLAGSIVFGGLRALVARGDRRERVRGLDGEWY